MLARCGALLVGIGGHFVVARAALLPEDARYIATPGPEIRRAVPGLAPWLRKVFRVLGGHVVAVGVLTLYTAGTAFRRRDPGTPLAVALAGLASVGWMAAVNVFIRSGFRWPLAGLAALWAGALALFRLRR